MSQEFTHLANRTSENVQKISQNASNIQKMVNQIGTSQDSESLRKSLHKIIHSTNSLAKDTNKLIIELSHIPLSYNEFEQKQQKLQKEKITEEFTNALNGFQSSQRKAATKEKASMERAKANSGMTFADIPFKEEQPVTFTNRQMHLQMEEDVNIGELREREASIRKLEADITDVNQIFKDLGMLVHEQGDMLDSIEANVETANVQVEQGNTQLKHARRYQVAARKKMCIIFGILIAIVTVLALIIWGVSK
ncbi:unnamed protein product [Gordionus sp. m RMFG-2023]|uniref:syntaxin-12-like n=1 Tax=Gordionus sp. m RMFG-2023 TaxID=3053472 RepID=UPI0030DF4072